MHGHSRSMGSFTLTTISALAHTSAALGTTVAPAARYASSANPEPIPAPCSTSTLWPSPTSDSTPAGTSATRFSSVLISLGTPTIMPAPPAPPRSVGPEPDHGLALGVEELGGNARDVVGRERRHRGQHFVETVIRLVVNGKSRQTIHPGGGTLQGEHQLALGLLLRLGQRVAREPALGEPSELFADRRCGLGRGLRLGADIHPGDAHLPVEARERIDRVGEPQLLADTLEQ